MYLRFTHILPPAFCYFYHFLLFKFDAHFLQTHPYGFPWRRYFAQSEHTNLSHTTHTSSLSINVFFRQDIHNAYPFWLNTLLLIPIFPTIPYFLHLPYHIKCKTCLLSIILSRKHSIINKNLLIKHYFKTEHTNSQVVIKNNQEMGNL